MLPVKVKRMSVASARGAAAMQPAINAKATVLIQPPFARAPPTRRRARGATGTGSRVGVCPKPGPPAIIAESRPRVQPFCRSDRAKVAARRDKACRGPERGGERGQHHEVAHRPESTGDGREGLVVTHDAQELGLLERPPELGEVVEQE